MRRLIPTLSIALVVLGTVGAPAWATPNLRSELLPLAQMPAGWSQQANTSGGGVGCLSHVLEPRGLRPTARAEATFDANQGLPELDEVLATYSVPVGKAFNRVVAVLDACHQVAGKSGTRKVTGTVGPMSFPRYGNKSAAFEVSLTVGGITLDEDVLVARRHDVVLGLSEGTVGAPSLRQFERFARAAVAKLG